MAIPVPPGITQNVSRTFNAFVADMKLANAGVGLKCMTRTDWPLLSWGEGVPVGTPTSQYYINTAATSLATGLYFGGDGLTWQAATNPSAVSIFIPPGTNATVVQDTLDTSGSAILLPGTHIWTSKVVVRAGCYLGGCGAHTVIRWSAAGNYAIELGETGQQAYDICIENFTLKGSNDSLRLGGGIEVKSIHQASCVQNVYLNDCKQHGLYITGSGEGLRSNGVVVRNAAGDGLNVTTEDTITTLHFCQCNFQANQGRGITLAALLTSQYDNLKFEDCIIQGNGVNGTTDAEIKITGYIRNTAFYHCWIERQNSAGAPATGILLDTNGTLSPGHIILDDDTYMYGYSPWTTSGRCAIKVKSVHRPPLLGLVQMVPIGTSGGSYNDGTTLRYKTNNGIFNPPRGQYRNIEDFDYTSNPGTWGTNQLIYDNTI